jgi:hypothetical protein
MEAVRIDRFPYLSHDAGLRPLPAMIALVVPKGRTLPR